MQVNTPFIVPNEAVNVQPQAQAYTVYEIHLPAARGSMALPAPTEEARINTSSVRCIFWTPDDKLFAEMFSPRDFISLKELERAIPAFDAHIEHSDRGFHTWCFRHRKAMRCGAAVHPGWPRLPTQEPNDSNCCNDEAWINRYADLVFRRQKLALQRLKRVPQRRGRNTARFFGDALATPRSTLQSQRWCRAVRELRNCWWKPLNMLLEEQARRWGVDAKAMINSFWSVEDKGTVTVKRETTAAESPHMGI